MLRAEPEWSWLNFYEQTSFSLALAIDYHNPVSASGCVWANKQTSDSYFKTGSNWKGEQVLLLSCLFTINSRASPRQNTIKQKSAHTFLLPKARVAGKQFTFGRPHTHTLRQTHNVELIDTGASVLRQNIIKFWPNWKPLNGTHFGVFIKSQ